MNASRQGSGKMFGILLLALTPAVFAQSYTPGFRYPNPDGDMNTVKRRGPCGDPWVTIAQEIVYGRAEASRCNISLYNNGQWDSFNTLVHAVAARKNAQPAQAKFPDLDLRAVKYTRQGDGSFDLFSNNNLKVGKLTSAGQITVSLPPNMVAAGGGNLITDGGSTMVAAGGGNMVAAGGGNMVAAGGGNMVAAGGGNLTSAISAALENNPRVSPMSGYALQGVARLSDLRTARK